MAHPFQGDHPLLYRLFDDPAVNENYRGIVKELSRTVFARSEIEKVLVDIETVNPRRDPALRSFLDSRVDYVKSVVAAWEK